MTTQPTHNKSFVLHVDSLNVLSELSDQQAGKLLKAIYQYQRTGEHAKLDQLLTIIINPLINQFKRDEEKYYNSIIKGKLGNLKKYHKKIYQQVIEGKITLENGENLAYPEKLIKSTTHRPPITPDTQGSYNVNDNVNINTNDNKNKNFIAPTLCDVEAYCKERKNSVDAKKFFDYYTAGNWKDAKGNKVKNWKQKLLTWEGRGESNTKDGPQSNANESLTLFVNNLMGHTLIESITISSSNKAVIKFKEKADFDKYSSLEEILKNQVKKKISEELGINGFEPKY